VDLGRSREKISGFEKPAIQAILLGEKVVG
jgi:hypothetical protein